MADRPELAGKLDRLRRQVQEFNRERGVAPVGKGGTRVTTEGSRAPRFGPPPRPLFRSSAGPPPRPLFRGNEAGPPARPLFRSSDGGCRPLFQTGAVGGPTKVPPRYSEEAAPPAKRQCLAPKEPTTETLLLHKVPADYTMSTLTELHEAVELDPESMAAVRFLRVSSRKGTETPTRSVVLRYRDESSASRALEMLHGHPVVSETGETMYIEVKWHDAEASGGDQQAEQPEDAQEEWAAPVEGEAAEDLEQSYDPELNEGALAEKEQGLEEKAGVASGQEGGQSLRSALMRFIRDNNVDEGAQHALWELGPEEQDQILGEGPCTGANPSAVLMSRIRRLAIERAAYAPPLNPGDVDRFLRENKIDDAAAATLRDCDPEIQKRVVAEGQVTGRNPSAIVASRIRRAQQERQGSGPIIRPVVVKPAAPVGKIIAPIRPVPDGVRKPVAVLPPRSIQQSSSGMSSRPLLPQIRVTTGGQRPPSIVPPAKRTSGDVASASPEALQPLLMALGAQALLGALGTSGNRPALAALRPAAPKPQVSVRPLFSARGQQAAAPRLLRPKASTGRPP